MELLHTLIAEGRSVVITDLRMGGGDYYVFRFKVGEVANPHAVPTPGEQLEATLDPQVLIELWHRLKGN